MSSAAARSDEASALAVEELVAGYGGVIALDRVSISAGTAAITAVLGANGAGKTTLLRAEAMAALDRVGAAEAAQARPGELPYGMRKRIALARALVAKPGLILLDEPASGLDESELAELGGLIRDLATEGSLVVVEHHMDLMMSVCDSIVVLDFGKVIATGTPREIQDDPAVTAAYLGTAHE